jgi:Holliday junction resolvasome RuvABC endonuclease subunit
MYNILALDQALVVSGYAAINCIDKEITYGTIKSPKGKGKSIEYNYWDRLIFIRDSMKQILYDHNCKILVLEEPFVSRYQHVSSAQSLQAVFTTLQISARDLGLEVYSIRPQDWAKALDLASTKQELLTVLKVYGLTNDHQSDAVGIGLGCIVKEKLIQVNIDRHDFKYLNGIEYNLSKC